MQELDKRIGLLRLLIADMEAKQAQLMQMGNQYRTQLSHIIEFVVYREGDVGNALSLMAEVQGKLDEVLQTSGHLDMILSKARLELEVLVLTKGVAEARSQLVSLEERQRELSSRMQHVSSPDMEDPVASRLQAFQMDDLRSLNEEVAAVAREISRLNSLITEASDRAARTIQPSAGRKP
jgi:predicted  nucleic acid-binding Zn-ribbon protein